MTPTKRILAYIYQKVMRTELKLTDLMLINPTTKLQLTYQGNSNSAYTTITEGVSPVFHVVLGGGMVAQAAKLPESFSGKAKLKPFLKDIRLAFRALNYHEMGHVLFSDMTLAPLIAYNEQYRGFVCSLFNIMEDPIIEINISRYVSRKRPYDVNPARYFTFLKRQIFAEQCESYKDDGGLGAFMQYLLLVLRCGKTSIPVTNAVYEKYSGELLPRIQDILKEPNATERQVKTTKLADWMIEHIKEFNWKAMSVPADLSSVVSHEIAEAAKGKSRRGPGDSRGGTMSSSISSEDSSDICSEGSDSVGAPKGEGAESERGESETESGPEKKDKDFDTESAAGMLPSDAETLDECFNDLLNCAAAHEYVIAKDEYEITDEDELNRGINEQLKESADCVQNITKFLSLFKGRKKPRRTGGFTSGKLNIPVAMQDEAVGGCETKLFCRTVARGQCTDLAVSLVCDNSGSMSGRRSHLASIGALALAQACDWTNTPFECLCFTKTSDSTQGTSITIVEKALDDTFEKSKPYFAINDSTLIKSLHSDRSIPTFAGNSEEVNLYYIGKEFAKCKHTTKLMFVFCDGATTGSHDSLRRVIQGIEKEGVHVIGIGLQSHDICRSYSTYKIFESMEDIKTGLAPYLVTTLSKYATK